MEVLTAAVAAVAAVAQVGLTSLKDISLNPRAAVVEELVLAQEVAVDQVRGELVQVVLVVVEHLPMRVAAVTEETMVVGLVALVVVLVPQVVAVFLGAQIIL
jgi:hypothetical protein